MRRTSHPDGSLKTSYDLALEAPKSHLSCILLVSFDSKEGELFDSTSQRPFLFHYSIFHELSVLMIRILRNFLLCPSLETIFLISSCCSMLLTLRSPYILMVIIHYISFSFFSVISCFPLFQIKQLG